jgi:hypothetical protein
MRPSTKTVFVTVLSTALVLIVGCKDQGVSTSVSSDQIRFSTDRLSYAESDTLKLLLANNSLSDINVGLRCGIYLEMFYQRSDNHSWGDTLWFPYMSFRCLTQLDTVGTKTTFLHSVPAQIFYATGTFRLVVRVYSPKTGTVLEIASNPFEVHS